MRYSHVAMRITTAGLLAGGLVTAATPAMAAAPQNAESTAYALSLTGPVNLGPLSEVSSSSDETTQRVLDIDQRALTANALSGSAESPTEATASATRLAVPAARLKADAITAKCENGQASAKIANAVLGEEILDSSPQPNTTVPVDLAGIGRVAATLNKQERQADGRMSVTALQLEVPLPGKPLTLKVASATCGKAAGGGDNGGGDDGGDNGGGDNGGDYPGGNGDGGNGDGGYADNGYGDEPYDAPAPSPVKHDLPVTG